jgi:hypothetical protein
VDAAELAVIAELAKVAWRRLPGEGCLAKVAELAGEAHCTLDPRVSHSDDRRATTVVSHALRGVVVML